MLCQRDEWVCIGCAWILVLNCGAIRESAKPGMGLTVHGKGQLDYRSGGILHTPDDDS